MYIHCTHKEELILQKIAGSAQKLDLPTYLIGGFLRDKILKRKTKDMDIVCVGDAITLAHEVAKEFHPKTTVNYFKKIGTAQIKIVTKEIKNSLKVLPLGED